MSYVKQLAPVAPRALAAFKARSDDIIRAVVAQALTHTEQVAGHGDQAERLLTAGLRYTALGLQTAIFLHNTTLLDWQLAWAADRLGHDGVQPEHILTRLHIYAAVVEQFLTADDALAINQYVHWMIAKQTELMAKAESRAANQF